MKFSILPLKNSTRLTIQLISNSFLPAFEQSYPQLSDSPWHSFSLRSSICRSLIRFLFHFYKYFIIFLYPRGVHFVILEYRNAFASFSFYLYASKRYNLIFLITSVISQIFKFSKDVRIVIYTTNAIESLNSTYRQLNSQRSVFPSDMRLLKALYLATFEATKKWIMPICNWGRVYGELAIMYNGRLPDRYQNPSDPSRVKWTPVSRTLLTNLPDSGRTVVKSRTAEPAVRSHLTLVVSRKTDIYRKNFREPHTTNLFSNTKSGDNGEGTFIRHHCLKIFSCRLWSGSMRKNSSSFTYYIPWWFS